jgi:hypothetical protein
MSHGLESGLDRMDGILFALMILSRIEDRRRRRRFAPSLTKSSTRTTSIHAIKAALRSVANVLIPHRRVVGNLVINYHER